LLDKPWVDADEVSSAILWLCSDEARSITGVELPIDAGTLVKWPGA
jgi:(+)-trans-carveol dehydrogenase